MNEGGTTNEGCLRGARSSQATWRAGRVVKRQCRGHQTPTARALRIVKLGGSLLDGQTHNHSEGTDWRFVLHTGLQRWLGEQPPIPSILIVGGGWRVEALRRNTEMVAPMAHWEAIRCMETNATDFARRHRLPLVHDLDAVTESTEPLVVLGRIEPILRASTLPQSWSVTSDSIAAWIAGRLGADELVLLKSCDANGSIGELAQAGIVDDYFPKLSMRTPYCIVNLRRWITTSTT